MSAIIKGNVFVEGAVTSLNQILKDEFDDLDKINIPELKGNILIKGNLIIEDNLIVNDFNNITAYATKLSSEEEEFYVIFNNDLKINGNLVVDNIKSLDDIICYK